MFWLLMSWLLWGAREGYRMNCSIL